MKKSTRWKRQVYRHHNAKILVRKDRRGSSQEGGSKIIAKLENETAAGADKDIDLFIK